MNQKKISALPYAVKQELLQFPLSSKVEVYKLLFIRLLSGAAFAAAPEQKPDLWIKLSIQTTDQPRSCSTP
jgi:hypothetical protein